LPKSYKYILNLNCGQLTQLAASERVRIAGETGRARTGRIVIDNFADRVGAAASRARINTLHADASESRTALGADQTFGPAVRRGADVAWQTRADADSVDFSFLTVGTARIGVAWVQVFNNRFAG
jgi:hypothetical protein